MNTAVRLPLNAASPAVVKDLQQKYPNAEMHIVVADVSMGTPTMNEDRFWEIIAQLDWSKEDNDEVLAPAAQALAACTEADIRQFSELLAKKLYDLDGERFAKEMAPDEIRWVDGELRFSVDLFLYARCVVVANGRDFYEAVIKDPTLMPKGYGFESLLYLDSMAWKIKTCNDDYSHSTEFWYETFNNPDGWPGIVPLKDRILGKNG
jgi:hypothetical protein